MDCQCSLRCHSPRWQGLWALACCLAVLTLAPGRLVSQDNISPQPPQLQASDEPPGVDIEGVDIDQAVQELVGEEAEGDFTKSVPFAADREVELTLKSASDAVIAEDWTKVATTLAEVLEHRGHTLIRQSGTTNSFVQARLEAHLLLRNAGPPAWEAFQNLVGARAAEEFKRAQATQNLVELRQISERYRYTDSGNESLELLARVERQRGNLLAAAAYWEARIENASDPVKLLGQRPELALGYLESLADLPDRTASFWNTYGAELQQRRLQNGELVAARLALIQARQAALPTVPAFELPLAVVPQWEHAFEVGLAAERELAAGLRDLAEHGLNPAPTWHGCQTNSGWVVSHPMGLTAVDATSGAPRWFLPHEWNSAQSYAKTEPVEDPLLSRLYRWELLMRMHGEATFNHLETDGQRIFYVIPEHPAGLFQMPALGQTRVFPSQSLVCRNASTGEFIWSTQGGQLAPVFFAGPPVRDANQLHVMIESQEAARFLLMSIDPETGSVLSVVDLFDPVANIVEDLRRTNRAGRVIPLNAQLLCATCSGGLIGVDRVTHEFQWAYRYGRDDLPKRSKSILDPQSSQVQYENWQGWRSVEVLPLHRESCLFVSPESHALHHLNPTDGSVYWTCPLLGARQLMGTCNGTALVLTDREVVAISLSHGQIIHRTAIPVPAGQGVLLGTEFVFPTAAGGLAQFNLTQQTCVQQTCLQQGAEYSGQETLSAPTVLLNGHGEVLSLSHQFVRRLAPLASMAIAAQTETNSSTSTAISRSQLLSQSQKFPEAWGVLSSQLRTSPPATEQQQLTSALLNTVLHWAETRGHAEVTEEARRFLCEQGALEQQLHWWRMVLEQSLVEADWEAAAVASQELWSRPLEQYTVMSPEGVQRCRADRWVQGLWQSCLESLNHDDRVSATKLVQSRLEELLAQPELNRAVLIERLGQLPWGQEWRAAEQPRWGNEQEYARHELRLLEQAALADEALQSATQLRLVQLYADRQEATRWYEIYRQSHDKSESTLPTLAPFAELLQRWQDKSPAVVEEPFADWGTTAPQLTIKDRDSSDIRFAGITVIADRGTLPQRLNVSIDFPGGQGLQFSNAELGRPWKVYSPTTGRFLRSNLSLSRVWGLGQQCIVQVGTELFGVSPTSVHGERRATIYWPTKGTTPIDTLGDRSLIMLAFYEEPQPKQIGFPSAANLLIDDYEHVVGAVGPVRPGYFCLQQKGMLVACDSATGLELWRRYELPELADCLGDDRQMVLWGRNAQTGKLLRALDGKFLSEVELPVNLSHRLLSRGPCVLCGTGVVRPDNELNLPDLLPDEDAPAPVNSSVVPNGSTLPDRHDAAIPAEGLIAGAEQQGQQPNEPLQLTWWNVLDHQAIWQHTWPVGSIPFEVDQEWCGVLTPAGELHIVDLSSGDSVTTQQVTMPLSVHKIVCSVGERTLLIAISGRIDDTALLAAGQIQQGYRRELMNGPLVCLDRRSGEKLWETTLANTVFPLDQPTDLPVFVMTSSRQGAENSPAPRSTLEIYDRRNGQQLYRDDADGPKWNFYAISGDRKTRRVQLKTQHQIFELDFAVPPTEQP